MPSGDPKHEETPEPQATPLPLEGGEVGRGGAGEALTQIEGEAGAPTSPQPPATHENTSSHPQIDRRHPLSRPLPLEGGEERDEAPLSLEPTPVGAPNQDAPTPKRRRRWGRALLLTLLVLILLPPLQVVVTKLLPPPVTILMIERLFQGRGLDKSWRSLDRIAPSLPTAVIAAEDAKFCEHSGFDWEAIQAASERNAHGGKVRGGSTISQQAAKNVFLWPTRDYLRKGLEAGYTVLIEKIWGKRRILEMYLNVVEWGPGLYGAQAASQRYFHEDASALTPQQSARLAAILPSPLKWKAVNPGRYVARRSRAIGANARVVREDDLAWCVRR